jgi:hypothetical protein
MQVEGGISGGKETSRVAHIICIPYISAAATRLECGITSSRMLQNSPTLDEEFAAQIISWSA